MLIIGNGKVITRDPERPWLADGAVVCDGAKIVAVGETGAMKAAYAAYTYRAAMAYPSWKIESVVDRVELDLEQRMDGCGVQPTVQVRSRNVCVSERKEA